MRSKMMETLSVEYPDKSRSHSASRLAVSATGELGYEEPDGFEMLNRVRCQLDSLKTGKAKFALGMIAAASKVCLYLYSATENDLIDVWNIQIHPCVESSWGVISSLHGVSCLTSVYCEASVLIYAPGVSKEGKDGFRSNQSFRFHRPYTFLR